MSGLTVGSYTVSTGLGGTSQVRLTFDAGQGFVGLGPDGSLDYSELSEGSGFLLLTQVSTNVRLGVGGGGLISAVGSNGILTISGLPADHWFLTTTDPSSPYDSFRPTPDFFTPYGSGGGGGGGGDPGDHLHDDGFLYHTGEATCVVTIYDDLPRPTVGQSHPFVIYE